MIFRHDLEDHAVVVDPKAWPFVTSFFRGNGGATLIAPQWLLTAAHVARIIPPDALLSVFLAGNRYRIKSVVLHPSYRQAWEDEEAAEEMADIALVELETPVEDIDPVPLYEDPDEQGQEVLLLGSGSYGNGFAGAIHPSDGRLRLATNRIDCVSEAWITFRFDPPPDTTAHEGSSGPGDSGNPAFIKCGSHVFLVGISSWQDTGHRPLCTYGVTEHYTRISSYAKWVRSVLV